MKVFTVISGLLMSSVVLAETELEEVTVIGTTEEKTSVPEKTEILKEDASNTTLGAYLDALPNVDSASYGEAVGRPVVRGMSGYRVKVLHNDNDLNDLSAMSQDHAVAVAPRASERIELLKGPASLLYAAQAGGVVKVSDSLDSRFPEKGIHGSVSTDHRIDADSHALDARVSVANDKWALRLGGLKQESDSYQSGNGDTIADSDVNTTQAQVGLSWKPNAQSELQINATKLDKDYGIPNNTSEATRIDMSREDLGIKYRYQPDLEWLDEITLDFLDSDYLHDETEGSRKDGLFGQQQQRGSLNAAWGVGDWMGETRIGLAHSELKVCHEHGACDAFSDATRTGATLGDSVTQYWENTGLPYSHGHPMPDTQSRIFQASTTAQKMLNDSFELSLGTHLQSRQLTPNPDNIQEQWVHPSGLDPDYYDKRDDHALSFSLGLNNKAEEKKLTWEASIGYLERFPSVDELYWNGFHHATDSYIFGDSNLDKERSVNLDFDIGYQHHDHLIQFSTFYYRFKDYIYQDRGYDDNGNALIDPFHLSQVWLTGQTDAIFYGGSLRYENSQLRFNDKPLTLWGQADVLDASKTNGETLPRTAPASMEVGVRYEPADWSASLSLKHVFNADKLAPNEEETSGYNSLNIQIKKDWNVANQEVEVWLKGTNLTDEYAENHLSVLKTTAPLPGRQISAGINWRF
ncbi:TonB-dependent receptor [Cocleimonas sp. KMM 6892]|uniref:TonB-dependent receptor n=1 Tax=unclassified Cocleimonas TaxID=2639732 RepID=UPI002DBB7A3C|nr:MULTISPECIES: TonB-dependent receptor [unclassified Cocleimonas]MEB8434309.1 TonB-dependent receptor [Cocleimonas sp. KMM 6892]MEC4717288.1 TonB-dependent receptor [Cocleimonas sp. KMM 6895]MEC4746667.1 TonB-dependent receptor [Cocleimonas sp. KMM 6896]